MSCCTYMVVIASTCISFHTFGKVCVIHKRKKARLHLLQKKIELRVKYDEV